MPKKGKKGSRPAIQHNNESLRRDIEAGRNSIDPFADQGDDGFDIADELLAALDERDAQEAASTSSKPVPVVKSPEAASIVSDSSSKSHSHDHAHSPSHSHHGLRGMINGLRHHHHNHDNESTVTDSDSLTGTSPSHTRKGSIRKLFGSSPKSPEPTPLDAGAPKKKVSRQQQRKDRKAAEIAQVRRQAEEEVRSGAGKPDEAEIERQGIFAMCAALGVTMHEINPDGHCLFAAVADQLMLRRKVSHPIDYKATRRATAEEMRSHPDEYKPFISDSDEHMAGINNREAGTLHTEKAQDKYFLDYCSAIENTGVWGGHAEILALTRAFKTQINVIQSGSPVLKMGEGQFEGEPLLISYHRKMYGLGEHYNSLHPAAIQI